MKAKSKCSICGRILSNPKDPFSEDCGGDCLMCMSDNGDPECAKAVKKILRGNKFIFRKGRMYLA